MDPLKRIIENPDKYMVYGSQAVLAEVTPDQVTFWLDRDYPENPFYQGKCDSEEPNGTRYILMAIELDDDETPVNIDMRQRVIDNADKLFKPPSTQNEVTRDAAIWCKSLNAHRFVYSKIKKFTVEERAAFLMTGIAAKYVQAKIDSISTDPEAAFEWCKHYLYFRCNVTSLRHFGHYKKDREAFNQFMREFETWEQTYIANQRNKAAS